MSEYREFTMKTIMVATDFSDASYGALNYAKQLARCLSAKILVVHVIDTLAVLPNARGSKLLLSQRIDLAEDELQRILSAFSHDGLQCAMIVRTGGIRETIASLIEERNADLLVIGTRGKDHKDGDCLGSVAEKLLRAMPCPVLTVGKYAREDSFEKTHPRTVLFPTDFSETSRAALEYTQCLTKHTAGSLCLLHVDETDTRTGSRSEHTEEFKTFVREMKDTSVISEYITRQGRPVDVITAVSNEKWVDFIVMGVHGADQAGKARNYGTAYDVIRSVRCPVFTLFVPALEEMKKTEAKSSIVC